MVLTCHLAACDWVWKSCRANSLCGLQITFIFSRFSLDGETFRQSLSADFIPKSKSSRLFRSLDTDLLSHPKLLREFQSKSSQQSEAPAPPEDTPVERRERRKWTPADDEVLISAWLNTSKDVVVGNEQKSGTFWKRVGEYYAASPHARGGGEKREHIHCKQRCHKINDLTNKFSGTFAAAERQNSSGQNDNDILKVAHDIFYSDHNMKFILEHAWCLLRYEQKWLNLNTPKATGSSKRKAGEVGSQSSSTNVGDHEIQPEGIKVAKARMNNAQGKALSEY
ncbi:glutathione S-transferase T3-like [Brassica napus]|uniref:glutathione S-transferase T3-like n=1 Tax=Brassica napus TaxID=3708 RepID=UPI002078A6F1|nr:glutathione S-transferase T3-like [Brassica napus]